MITEISIESAYQAVIQSHSAILFKHSTVCPTSAAAYREVRSFAEAHPDVQVFIVKVIEHRDLSNRFAEYFHIRHESPQIIVIKDGRAITNFSHHRITLDAIENSV